MIMAVLMKLISKNRLELCSEPVLWRTSFRKGESVALGRAGLGSEAAPWGTGLCDVRQMVGPPVSHSSFLLCPSLLKAISVRLLFISFS